MREYCCWARQSAKLNGESAEWGPSLHQVSEVGEVRGEPRRFADRLLSGERRRGHRNSWRQSHSPSVPGAGRRGRAGGGAYAANALRIESLLMSVTSSCVELPPAVMWCCERDSPDQSALYILYRSIQGGGGVAGGRRRRLRYGVAQ